MRHTLAVRLMYEGFPNNRYDQPEFIVEKRGADPWYVPSMEHILDDCRDPNFTLTYFSGRWHAGIKTEDGWTQQCSARHPEDAVAMYWLSRREPEHLLPSLLRKKPKRDI